MPKQLTSEANPITGLHSALYWIGVLTTAGCLLATLAGNTGLVWQVQHKSLPLSWILGLVAIAAFLAAELAGRIPATTPGAEFTAETIQLQQEA